MARSTTTITVLGDDLYVQAVKAVAFADEYPSIGAFVRDAIDAFAGDRLASQIADFLAKRDSKNAQMTALAIIPNPTTEPAKHNG